MKIGAVQVTEKSVEKVCLLQRILAFRTICARGHNSCKMSENTDWDRVLKLVKDLLCGQLDLDNSEDDAQRDSHDSRDENSRLVLKNLRKLCTYTINVVSLVCKRDFTEEELDELNQIIVHFAPKVKRFQD